MIPRLSPASRRALGALVVSLVAASAAWLLAQQASSDAAEGIVASGGGQTTVAVTPGTTLRQTFAAAGGTITQVTLYPVRQYRAGQLFVRLVDLSGTVRSASVAEWTAYEGTPAAQHFALTPVDTRPEEPLAVEARLAYGPAVELATVRPGPYPHGALTINDQATASDLAFDISLRERAPFGARQGTLAGIATLFGATLIALVPERYRWRVAAGLLIILIPPAVAGFWFSTGPLGANDWDYYLSSHESYRRLILDHHEFPLWNPYTCGGIAALGDPEFPVLSAAYPLELLLGVPPGLRAGVYLTLAIMAIGTLVLARRLGLTATGAFLASLGASLSTALLLKFAEGHVQYFGAAWLPWVLWAWLRARQTSAPRNETKAVRGFTPDPHTVLVGVFLALMFYGGAIYVLFYTGLALIGLILLVPNRRRALGLTVRAGLWALGLSAAKLLPVLAWMRQFPDTRYAPSGNTLPYLMDIFLGRHLHGATVVPDAYGGWHEYGAYVGPFLLALALVALTARRQRRARRLAGAVAISVALAASGPWLRPLFDALAFLPRSMISRLHILTVLGISLLAGMGLDHVRRRLPGGRLLAPVWLSAAAITLMSLAYQISEQAFTLPAVGQPPPAAAAPITFTAKTHPVRRAGVTYDRTYAAAERGYGTLTYCSPLAPDPKVIPLEAPEYTGYLTLASPTATGQVIDWSPRRVTVAVTALSPTPVTINANFVPGWSVENHQLENHRGRLGTTVAAGTHTVIFRYRVPYLTPGLTLSILTTGAALGVLFLNARRSAPNRVPPSPSPTRREPPRPPPR